MLTNDDKKFIQESIRIGFQDFYENIFEPYVAKNEKEHREIVKKIVTMDKDVNKLNEKTGEIGEQIKDYGKRIRKLEAVTGV